MELVSLREASFDVFVEINSFWKISNARFLKRAFWFPKRKQCSLKTKYYGGEIMVKRKKRRTSRLVKHVKKLRKEMQTREDGWQRRLEKDLKTIEKEGEGWDFLE